MKNEKKKKKKKKKNLLPYIYIWLDLFKEYNKLLDPKKSLKKESKDFNDIGK